jgi:hypothetical protein
MQVYGLTETFGHVVQCAWRESWNALDFPEQASLKARQGIAFPITEDVRVVAPFLGGGFGGKIGWSNTPLCVAAAKVVNRPVKLALTREDTFRLVGGRTISEQYVGLGAQTSGALRGVQGRRSGSSILGQGMGEAIRAKGAGSGARNQGPSPSSRTFWADF